MLECFGAELVELWGIMMELVLSSTESETLNS
nr:MAG TPA: hypothetical protein [Caudoviricetes sp.]